MNATPLQNPFRVTDLRLSRFDEIDGQLNDSRVFQACVSTGIAAQAHDRFLNDLDAGLVAFPDGTLPFLDEAVATVRTRFRLCRPVSIHFFPKTHGLHRDFLVIALANDDGFQLMVTPRVLEADARPFLPFLIGNALYNALETGHRELRALVLSEAPVPVEDRKNILARFRLQEYLAACAGFLACGDLDNAMRGSWFLAAPGSYAASIADPLAAGRHALKNPDEALMVDHQIARGDAIPPMLPVKPLVLRRFSETAYARAMLGLDGGIAWDAFEADLLDWDQAVHEPDDDVPDDHSQAIACALLVGPAHVLRTTGPLTDERLEIVMNLAGCDREGFERVRAGLSWEIGSDDEADNTADLAENIFSGNYRPLMHVHAYELLLRAMAAALSEADTQLAPEQTAAITQLAEWIGVATEWKPALFGAIHARLIEIQNGGDDEAEGDR